MKSFSIFLLSIGLMIYPLAACSHQCEQFKIAIDIGHSLKNPGAISSRGIPEYSFNKAIAELLLEELHSRNFSSAFILVPDGSETSLKRRTEIAGEKKADMFISIHHDSVQPKYLSSWIHEGEKRQFSDLFQGFSIFVSRLNRFYLRSLQLAQLVGDQLLKTGMTPTMHHAEKIDGENRPLLDKRRGIYEFSELGVVKSTPAPAILLECGIIVNRSEEELLSDPEYKRKLVFAISESIQLFFFEEINRQNE